jgi:mRNA interferase MazF
MMVIMEEENQPDIQFEPIAQKHVPNLDEWHGLKKEVCNKHPEQIPYFYEREMWWCCLGMNVGYEEDGKNGDYSRPVVIIKIFNRELFWGIPLTSKDKTGKYYHQYEFEGKKYSAILSQLRVLSSKRLIRKVGTMPEDDFSKMKKRTISLL